MVPCSSLIEVLQCCWRCAAVRTRELEVEARVSADERSPVGLWSVSMSSITQIDSRYPFRNTLLVSRQRRRAGSRYEIRLS
jgi:hypothetical protein